MGVFVNFKDYHGNTMEAVTKLLNDLKKFGSQAARNVKPETLQAGFGEEICHIVDELLNIELYRREYQFHPPVFPEEVDESGHLDDFQDDPNLQGAQEINGIQIQTQEDTRDLIGGSDPVLKESGPSNTNLQREITTHARIEETKIGFFNAALQQEQELLFEKAEENQILEAILDPLEWRLEVETVYKELQNIEKEIELQRQRGQGILDDDIEEHRRHLEMIIELCREIQSSLGYETRRVFARVGGSLQDMLDKIRMHEMRMNKQNHSQVVTLNAITQKKKGLATELRAVIDRVKAMDYESKDLSNAISAKEHDYEEKMRDATGQAMLQKLKQAIAEIKVEVRNDILQEGVMNNILFSCAEMRRGQHHLYDEMADPVKVSETGTKNNTEEAQKVVNEDVDEDFNY